MPARWRNGNLRKRTARGWLTPHYGITGFARDVLDIADNLQRALDAVPAEAKANADPGLLGVDRRRRIDRAVAAQHAGENGVRNSIRRAKFDPICRRCEVPDPSVPAGTVVQVAGRLHDRRARAAARGRVSKGGAKAASAEQA